jgi:hypothetical protein
MLKICNSKGEMKTYFVDSRTDPNGNPMKCPFTQIYEDYIKKTGKQLMEDGGKNSEKGKFTLINENEE